MLFCFDDIGCVCFGGEVEMFICSDIRVREVVGFIDVFMIDFFVCCCVVGGEVFVYLYCV